MTCFLLLLLYARYESSFDSSFKNSGRIYQIGQILPAWNVGGSNRFPSTSGALAAGLKREFPEVEYAVRVKETETPIVYEQNSVLARGLFVDGDFLSVFSYPLSAGEAKTALQEPFTAILSESLAGKLFGRVDPLGKIITHMDGREFKVTGIIKDIPRNTHLKFDYLFNLFGMTIVRGRNFSPALLGDIGGEVVINETAARMAGLQNPVGKAFVMGNRRLRVIGVVKDIHFTSLKTKIGPLMFTYRPAAINMFFARISGSKADETIRFILSTFRRHNPAFVSDFTTMDDIYNALYQNERKLAGILISFSVMAILIASIGLFGLISFIVEKKKKEIGIRKVLGAPVFAIMGLIIRDLFALIAVAGLMALPVAYYFSHRWLGSFAYRIRLDAGVFLLATSIVMLIALLSVARVTMRAARENPARSLRNV
jgi:ABC-type antimicrobial peptide transport system permease subunit